MRPDLWGLPEAPATSKEPSCAHTTTREGFLLESEQCRGDPYSYWDTVNASNDPSIPVLGSFSEFHFLHALSGHGEIVGSLCHSY